MNHRTAIHAHVYYPGLWGELAECIDNFKDTPFDLFVTLARSDSALEAEILSRFPRAEIRVIENRGYDLGPFIDCVNRLDLDTYDFVAKLYTKRNVTDWVNYLPLSRSQWRRWLLSFCAAPRAVAQTFGMFEAHPEIGMAAHGSLIVGGSDFSERPAVREKAREEIARFGLVMGRPEFVAGTMFMVRASLLKPMQGKISLADFAPVTAHEEATLAHVYERVLGYLVGAQGFRIGDTAGVRPLLLATESLRKPVSLALRGMHRFFNSGCS